MEGSTSVHGERHRWALGVWIVSVTTLSLAYPGRIDSEFTVILGEDGHRLLLSASSPMFFFLCSVEQD